MTDATLQEAGDGNAPKKKRGIPPILMPLGLLMMLPIAPATFTIIAVYMAPTMMLVFFRTLRLPGAAGTVAGLNFAGTMPALHLLWTTGNDFQTAYLLIFNLEYMFINLAAAGIGISLLWISPFVAHTWVDIAGQRLLARAQEEREKLLDEWGDSILTPDEDEDDEDDNQGAGAIR